MSFSISRISYPKSPIQNHQSKIQNRQGDRPSVIEWLTGSSISHIGTRA
ncbi:hypothetical protein HNI00_16860 [Thermoleptolyngbya oregonensis NK1-22]|uniref:Uncharacterized protein n=1 Tax=Thermoleptolyngbya oregonensis NK1-22 TaxID=2547457 RepID=A0AA96YQP0_9CYAN|nr:hypothetical protein [Thermoleptolyngbya oregonensis]WOB44632.1 hypothetical protein HNI00_16860 [Thermoleptolyngbya oregonensis NK1-22]